MKTTLIATVATAALAMSVPAFAQADDPTATVQGSVESQVDATTPDIIADPADTAVNEAEETQQQAEESVADAEATTEAEAEAATRALATGEGARVGVEAEGGIETPTATASAEADASAEMTLPSQVQAEVADGEYTTADLNRAQLAALQTP
ncbi:MAG: hypothetical protein R3C16_07495 [Hyphomonadaceae bacterium]